jgi:predicted PhzF superfamily epimerase YddE/YHI9
MATQNEKIQIELTKQEVAILKEQNKTEHQALMKAVKELSEKIDVKFNDLDKKYAPRWVQTVVGTAISLILVAFITALISFVIIPDKTSAIQICERYVS